jgi:L-arabinose isomerase
MVRILKAMSKRPGKGVSFMEDYTYDFNPGSDLILGAHMLEVCPSIASAKPVLDVRPLGIGGKADPARLIFSAAPGEAVVVGVMDMGGRFRILVSEVEVVPQPQPLPKLPVARAFWACKPDFETGVEGWIVAGGGHHTVLSFATSPWQLKAFADELGIECVTIGDGTTMDSLKKELRWNEAAYRA